MQQMTTRGSPLDERRHKARVGADVDQSSATAHHSSGFGERSLGVVKVGMGVQ